MWRPDQSGLQWEKMTKAAVSFTDLISSEIYQGLRGHPEPEY